jgi:multidrug efflux pump subunit AcrA (membrane-fusion protein)
MKTRHLLAIVALAAACITLALSARAQSPATGSNRLKIEGCLVTLINDVMVPAQEAGRLMKVNVKGGEEVDENSVIAEIDNRDTLAKRKIAQGEFDVATTQADSDAELELGKKGVEVSKAEYDQNVEIRTKNPGAVSDTELRKFKFQWDRAKAQVKVAEVDRVVAGLTAKVKEAQLEATANELARRQITAPFKGEVEDVKRQVGEWVQPGEPIARIVQLDRLRVKGMVYANATSPTDVIGKPVEITIMAAGGKTELVKGHIDFVSSIIEVTGEFRVWCDIDNQKYIDPVTKKESWKIQPGSSAMLSIDLNPPPPPKPVAPLKAEPAKGGPTIPGTFRPRSALDASGVKVESLKPIVGEPAATKPEDKKPEDKSDETKNKRKER